MYQDYNMTNLAISGSLLIGMTGGGGRGGGAGGLNTG